MVGRQRQYFEQKKRQQQTAGLQNQDGIDGAGGQAVGDQAPRSLDILSLNNLAAPVSHRNGPESEFLTFCTCFAVFEVNLLHIMFSVVDPAALLAQCQRIWSSRLTNVTLVR